MKTLLEADVNERVIVHHIEHEPSIKRRLMDLGFMEEGSVTPVLDSPGKGMRAYLVKGCKIALRDCEGKGILVYEKGEENAD